MRENEERSFTSSRAKFISKSKLFNFAKFASHLTLVLSLTTWTIAPVSAMSRTSSVDTDSLAILQLFNGEHAAFNISFSAGLNYVLTHDYPGVIDSAKFKACSATWSDKSGDPWAGGGKNFLTPDLTTIQLIATFTPRFTATDTKPFSDPVKGKTYQLTENTTGGSSSTIHVTILNGKAYYYFWACGSSTPSGTLGKALVAYGKQITPLGTEENALLAAYASVTGSNYKSDQTTHDAILAILPRVQKFVSKLEAIQPTQPQILVIHNEYIDAWNLQSEAMIKIVSALENSDLGAISDANAQLAKGRAEIRDFLAKIKALAASAKS